MNTRAVQGNDHEMISAAIILVEFTSVQNLPRRRFRYLHIFPQITFEPYNHQLRILWYGQKSTSNEVKLFLSAMRKLQFSQALLPLHVSTWFINKKKNLRNLVENINDNNQYYDWD